LLSSSSPIAHQQIIDTQPPQPGESGSKSSQLASAKSNTSLIGTEQERRHQLVHRYAANAASTIVTQDAHLKIIRKTGGSTNQMQHAFGRKAIHIDANGC